MIVVVDKTGQEQDLDAYRRRVEIPVEMQARIREYVRIEENGLEEFDTGDLNRFRSKFYRLVDGFLTGFTYTQNLLENPYHPSEETIKRLELFRGMIKIPSVGDYGEHWFERCTNEIYYLEKAMRAGANKPLDGDLVRTILDGEDFIFASNDYAALIKLLGRHEGLGLPPVDNVKKPQLQKIVNESGGRQIKGYDSIGFLCSAQRAGFDLPPVDMELLNIQITKWVQTETSMDLYISVLHHLRELLCS